MIFKIMFRTVFFYLAILFSYKLMGKREVGELGIFDFVISMLISQLIAISIENYKDSIFYALVPLIILVILQIIIAKISIKNKKFRDFVDGKESLIIKNGIINIKEMIRQRYSMNDLLMQLRDKDIRNVSEVEYAILETNGRLSVFKKDDKDNKNYPLPIIIDGNIEYENLRYINKDEDWLIKNLTMKKVQLNDIFYAFLKGYELFIIKKN